MKLNPTVNIYLADSEIENANRGIFAASEIKEGDLIESCPIIFTTEEDYPLLKQTMLRNYYFLNEPENRSAIALGYGSLYNHSYEPNATYKKRLEEGFIDFYALKDIQKDEEVTVNYWYGDPDNKKKLWMDDVPEFKEL
jgi:SET domain-containing protein